MGIIKMLTADLQDVNIWTTAGDAAINSTYARTGTYSFRKYNDYSYITFPNLSEGYAKVAIRGTTNDNTVMFNEGASIQLKVLVNITTGEAKLYRGASTLLDTVSGVVTGEFQLYEFHWIIHDSTGVFQMKIDGVQHINFSGDTKETGTGVINNLGFYGNATGYSYWDDIVIRDDQWPGAGGLYVLTPNAGTTQEDWAASAGNPEDCVDELPVSFSDYIYTSADVAGSGHRFGITTLPSDITNIGGIGVFAKIQSTETIDADVRNVIYSGTTQSNGSGLLLSTNPSWHIDYWTLNPDDAAAWEKADIDALEIGVETLG